MRKWLHGLKLLAQLKAQRRCVLPLLSTQYQRTDRPMLLPEKREVHNSCIFPWRLGQVSAFFYILQWQTVAPLYI